ncbi:unnamed protein product, partial [Tetraodon nigroviridis]
LGFTKCGRYVLSYTSDCGEDDDFSFYIYHLYWWEFNLHSRLKQVHHVRLFAGEEIYSDLYLTVCEWPNDRSKIVIFGFNTRSSRSILMNLMMSDENNRDIYVTIASMPPPKPCSHCCPFPSATTIRTGHGECLEHGYVLNSRYQVVYPFPTFQPAFQLKKDQVILLNTSYSLVACGISLCPGKQGQMSQILYTRRAAVSHQVSAASSSSFAASSSRPQGGPENGSAEVPLSPTRSQAAAPARESAAEIFRQFQGGGGGGGKEEGAACLPQTSTWRGRPSLPQRSAQVTSPASSSSSPSSPLTQEATPTEPGYVNYSRLHYRLQQPGAADTTPEVRNYSPGIEDDKFQLPFTVTDLRGQNLQLVSGPPDGQSVCVEQLTLDFEYLINEVFRSDAAWAPQFCSFSDYDVVILEVCPETNTVILNIGLLLLAFSVSDEERCRYSPPLRLQPYSPVTSRALKLCRNCVCRPSTYHSNLQVSWDLNTGACCTVGVGDLTAVRGQTSGSVWSSYRRSCVNTVMKWLVPESSSRYINRMTNEALHKGASLQVLADSDRCTWIVL